MSTSVCSACPESAGTSPSQSSSRTRELGSGTFMAVASSQVLTCARGNTSRSPVDTEGASRRVATRATGTHVCSVLSFRRTEGRGSVSSSTSKVGRRGRSLSSRSSPAFLSATRAPSAVAGWVRGALSSVRLSRVPAPRSSASPRPRDRRFASAMKRAASSRLPRTLSMPSLAPSAARLLGIRGCPDAGRAAGVKASVERRRT